MFSHVLIVLVFFDVLIRGISGINDPIAVYPFNKEYEKEDASACNNPPVNVYKAKMTDDKDSDRHGYEFKKHRSYIIVRNINGKLKAASLSILVWIKPKFNNEEHRVLVKWSSEQESSLILSLQKKNLVLAIKSRCDDDDDIHQHEVEVDWKNNEWHFVGATYNHTTGNITLAIHDKIRSSGFVGYFHLDEPSQVVVGILDPTLTHRKNRKEFVGEMSCLMFYRRALSFTEITNAKDTCINLQQKSDPKNQKTINKPGTESDVSGDGDLPSSASTASDVANERGHGASVSKTSETASTTSSKEIEISTMSKISSPTPSSTLELPDFLTATLAAAAATENSISTITASQLETPIDKRSMSTTQENSASVSDPSPVPTVTHLSNIHLLTHGISSLTGSPASMSSAGYKTNVYSTVYSRHGDRQSMTSFITASQMETPFNQHIMSTSPVENVPSPARNDSHAPSLVSNVSDVSDVPGHGSNASVVGNAPSPTSNTFGDVPGHTSNVSGDVPGSASIASDISHAPSVVSNTSDLSDVPDHVSNASDVSNVSSHVSNVRVVRNVPSRTRNSFGDGNVPSNVPAGYPCGWFGCRRRRDVDSGKFNSISFVCPRKPRDNDMAMMPCPQTKTSETISPTTSSEKIEMPTTNISPSSTPSSTFTYGISSLTAGLQASISSGGHNTNVYSTAYSRDRHSMTSFITASEMETPIDKQSMSTTLKKSVSVSDSSPVPTVTNSSNKRQLTYGISSLTLSLASSSSGEHKTTVYSTVYSRHSDRQPITSISKRTTIKISTSATATKATVKPFKSPLLSISGYINASTFPGDIEFQPTATLKGEFSANRTTGIKGHDSRPTWSTWSIWSVCNKPCGTGSRMRTRVCSESSDRFNETHCVGKHHETIICIKDACPVIPLNIMANLTQEKWDDSLLSIRSVNFKRLESKLRRNMENLYGNDSNLISVTLNHCRKGSLIVNFTATFKAVDSDQIVKLAESVEKEGKLFQLPIITLRVSVPGVPNQTPNITGIYLTSSSSLKVFWTSVHEPIDGYQVVYRPDSGGQWNSIAVENQTTYLELKTLMEGTVNRIRVLAFNGKGNGIPSTAVQIMMVEGVPKQAPLVTVHGKMDSSSLFLSWTAIPEKHVTGRLLGYHVVYRPVKIADRPVQDTVETTTVAVDIPGRLYITLKGLSSYASYSVTVAGFTAKGDGKTSASIIGDTCRCPEVLYTNWAELPPYVSKSSNGLPGGILGDLVEQMILSSCGTCNQGYGRSTLNFLDNGKGGSAKKTTMNSVRQDVDDRTQVSFPVIGNMDDDKFQREYVFVPVVESPGIAFITVSASGGSTNDVFSAMGGYLPLYLLSLVMAYVAGVLIWMLDSKQNPDTFPRSFPKGAGEGFWFSFVSMTTVGYGDRVPIGFFSRIFTIAWILTGLVMASLVVGIISSSLTFSAVDTDIILYGTKVTALTDSPAHRLGVRRNAKVEPRDTLEEACDTLKKGEVRGLLLDAYVAGSQMQDVPQDLLVKEVMELSKGFGVVLSGETIKLQHIVIGFIRSNANRITKIIENSTSPLEQPAAGTAEEQAIFLFDPSSSAFRQILMILVGALGSSVFCGLIWEAARKGLGRATKINPENTARERKNMIKTRTELCQSVEEFYQSFKQVFTELRYKYKEELKKLVRRPKLRNEELMKHARQSKIRIEEFTEHARQPKSRNEEFTEHAHQPESRNEGLTEHAHQPEIRNEELTQHAHHMNICSEELTEYAHQTNNRNEEPKELVYQPKNRNKKLREHAYQMKNLNEELMEFAHQTENDHNEELKEYVYQPKNRSEELTEHVYKPKNRKKELKKHASQPKSRNEDFTEHARQPKSRNEDFTEHASQPKNRKKELKKLAKNRKKAWV